MISSLNRHTGFLSKLGKVINIITFKDEYPNAQQDLD